MTLVNRSCTLNSTTARNPGCDMKSRRVDEPGPRYRRASSVMTLRSGSIGHPVFRQDRIPAVEVCAKPHGVERSEYR